MSELYSKTILMMKVIVIMMMMKKMPLTMFMLLKRHPGVYHAVIFCVKLLLSGADLRHSECNFTGSWLAEAAPAFQTKPEVWSY